MASKSVLFVDDDDILLEVMAAQLAELDLKVVRALADKDDVNGITKRINGGFNGLQDRKNKLAIAKRVWKDEA